MPFVQTRHLTISRALSAAMVGALSARPAAALLVTPTVKLFTALTGVISPVSTVSQFVEATFVGYAAAVLPALSAVINLPSGTGVGAHAEVDFLGGAVVFPGETIMGYWIDDGAGGFIAAELFDNVVTIVNLGDFLSLDVVFGLNNPTTVS